MTKLLRKNLKKLVKHITSFLMKREKRTTINLAMLPLKELAEVVKDLEDLTLLPFQIFLKIFLAILVEVVPQEDQAIEETI